MKRKCVVGANIRGAFEIVWKSILFHLAMFAPFNEFCFENLFNLKEYTKIQLPKYIVSF